MSKFDSARDEALYHLCTDGWANNSTGEDDFGLSTWIITNEEADRDSIVDVLEAEGMDPHLLAELIGTFIVTLNTDGLVTVTKFDGREAAEANFGIEERRYIEWLDGVERDDFYLTFGVQYRREPHPSKHPVDPDGYVRITAKDEPTARQIAFSYYGPAWSQLTPSAYWHPYREDGTPFFPKGETAHYTSVNPEHPVVASEAAQGEVGA